MNGSGSNAYFEESVRDGVAALAVEGAIDMSSADEFRARVSGCLQRTASLEIDLTEVTFMDSSGLSVLVWAHRTAVAAGKQATLVNLSSNIDRLLQVSGLHKVLDIRPTPT